jgi:exodeoxyribonuclease VII large subunit
MKSSTSKNIFTVASLTSNIKNLLEGNFKDIYVQGEVTNLKIQSSGHIYFSLKDQSAQISCALFKGYANYVKQLPKSGDKIIIRGDISVYPPRGGYQMIVKGLSFVGVGELLIKLHELKLKLKNLGWFDKEHKKPLPAFPKKIGVITSPTGAVIQDILNVLSRRFSSFNLLLNPVKVQGDGAAREIAKAIYEINKHNLVDVIIVGRGGGSLEDLWAFNEEIVAKAIFESKIPIISAVGHETDISLSDYVADIRAPTPSAAAEIVIAEKEQILNSLETYNYQLKKLIFQKIKEYRLQLQSIEKQPIFSSSYTLLGQYIQQLDDISPQFSTAIKNYLQRKKDHLESIRSRALLLNPKTKILILKQRLQTLASHLRSLDPKNLLKKGYSIILSQKTNSTILSTKQVEKDDKIYALVSDGKILAKIEEVKS